MQIRSSFPATGSLLAIAAALLLASATCLAQEPRQVLTEHEQLPWQLAPEVERIAIANPEIADIAMLRNRQALLVGKSPGTTTLLIWNRGQSQPQRLPVEVRTAVQGGLMAGSPAQLTSDRNKALLAGQVPSMLDHQRARQAASAVAGKDGFIADSSLVASGGVVQVEVKVVELNKTALSRIGVNFQNTNGGFSYGMVSPGGRTANGGDSALSSAFGLVAQQLLPNGALNWRASLDLLQSNGMARVLAEPTLVALSGQSASFLAGGELPILEPQGLGTTTVTFKPFGIGLTVTPTVLSPDRIALKVAPEASDLDYTSGVSYNGVQVPSITTRRADTTVELGDGESFVIGGLVSSTLSSTVNKVPLLGDLPVLGSFFRNMDYRKQDKELVIVVTPRLVRPLARNTELTLPGDQETRDRPRPWASWLLHPAGNETLPGFSR
jgi:pilus assembly protein CpaC